MDAKTAESLRDVASHRALAPRGRAGALAWIEVAAGAPYFATETGEPWTPVGQNDAISWVELAGLRDGAYRIEALDTAERRVLGRIESSSHEGVLQFDTSPIARDLAFVIRRLD
jgi:hypothetical protein